MERETIQIPIGRWIFRKQISEHVIAQKIEYECQQKLSSRVNNYNRKKEIICFIQ